MAQPAVQEPKVHPLLIGGGYGLVAAIIQVLVYTINHAGNKPLNNGLLGFVASFLLPLIALYLAGHYAGRHQRLTSLKTSVTSGARATVAGTGAGFATGLVYVIASLLLNLLPFVAHSNSGGVGAILGFLANIGGLIIWPLVGLLLGTFGGVFGDSRAHKQLKSGAA